ncbi:unnamed protein product [Symbiodinium sp. CCMP2592]|nr:unnamed protein product [Symbiodinium sp. CCMP2592]
MQPPTWYPDVPAVPAQHEEQAHEAPETPSDATDRCEDPRLPEAMQPLDSFSWREGSFEEKLIFWLCTALILNFFLAGVVLLSGELAVRCNQNTNTMFRRLARRTVKLGALGATAFAGVKIGHMWINDDLDDIKYEVDRVFYHFAKKEQERRKVVVLGSGWGALSFVRKLDPSQFDVTVVSPRPFFFYTPLLVGSTTGVVSPGAIIEPIRDNVPNCDFLRVHCKDVDLEEKKVHCDTGLTLDYDHLVVAVGAQPNTFGIPGVDKYGRFLKEIEHGRALRKEMLDIIEKAEVANASGDLATVKRLLNFVVVGGGPTGVEFCGELSDFIKQDIKRRYPKIAEHFQVTLVEALPGLLTMFHKSVGNYVQDHLASQGVDVKLNAMVKEVEPEKVHLKTKEGVIDMDYGILVWVAGVGMRPFTRSVCEKIGKENGQTDRRGLLVDECLRVKGTKLGEVFAIGDCAVSGKPPTAQVAYQQGKYLGRMFRLGKEHLISDPEAAPFKYCHQGTMAYIGDSQGAAEIDPNAFIKLGRSSVTDHMWWRSLYGDTDQLRVMGPAGFAIWRSTYFSAWHGLIRDEVLKCCSRCMLVLAFQGKLFSSRNRWSVASDWLRTGGLVGDIIPKQSQFSPQVCNRALWLLLKLLLRHVRAAGIVICAGHLRDLRGFGFGSLVPGELQDWADRLITSVKAADIEHVRVCCCCLDQPRLTRVIVARRIKKKRRGDESDRAQSMPACADGLDRPAYPGAGFLRHKRADSLDLAGVPHSDRGWPVLGHRRRGIRGPLGQLCSAVVLRYPLCKSLRHLPFADERLQACAIARHADGHDVLCHQWLYPVQKPDKVPSDTNVMEDFGRHRALGHRCINLDADHRLRSLRKPGETGYKVPRGGMFEYISGANFFGEIVEWTGYALAMGFALPGLTFALCTAANIGPRALWLHR